MEEYFTGRKHFPERTERDMELKGVDFSYDGKRKILKNIDVFARPGEKVAFVGATGAGKTTITNLLNRFYDIQKGEIITTASISGILPFRI